MHQHSRLLSGTVLFIGLALLALEVGDRTTDAARGPAPRAWTREGPSRRAAAPAPRRADPDAATTQRVHEQYGRLPLSFEKNEGQTDRRVAFLSRGPGYTLFLMPGAAAVLALSGAGSPESGERDPASTPGATPRASLRGDGVAPGHTPESARGGVVRLTLVGANTQTPAAGRDALPGTVNYLKGNDRTQWRAGISTYARVAYDNVYPGIDVVYYGNPRQLEYDFVVRPGADPRTIALEVDGADTLALDAQGDLVLDVGGRQLRQRKPVAYQEVEGVRTAIDSGYTLEGNRRVRFQLGAYDGRRPVVIEPTLVYSTYLGGSGQDFGEGIAVDATGSAYVTGYTRSSDFPTTAGAFDTSWNGGASDAFVTKLDAAGAALVYSTYLGGSFSDSGYGVAVDTSGSAYVTGETQSSNFPTTAGAFGTRFNGLSDAFVTKLDAAGAALVYSTYLGGFEVDRAYGVAIDASGSAYVVGSTDSADFPTTAGAFDTSGNGNEWDAFVTKLDAAGAALVYSTFLGGSGGDEGRGVAVDASGSAYVTGSTWSSDYPTTAGAVDTSWNGGDWDAFVTKLDAAGAALAYSTYLGGSVNDYGQGVAVDASGSAYVTGSTDSSNFPTTASAVDTSWNYSTDAFVTKLDVTGATLASSSFLGSTREDTGSGVAVDATGNAYVTGQTSSFRNFPTTPGAFDTSANGEVDAFVTKISDGGPPAPSVTLTANGTHGPLTLASGDSLTIAVSFDAGGAGVVNPAEVYIGVATPFGWLWFDPTSHTFVPTPTRVYTGPLASFEPVALVNLPNVSVLSPGRYWWFMLLDRDSNGVPDGPSFDLVVTDVVS